MVRGMAQTFFGGGHMENQLFQPHSLRRLPPSPLNFATSWRISCLYMHGSIFGVSVLFHWPICPSWCQYHAVLTIAILMSGSVSALVLFFLFKVVLATLGPLIFIWILKNLIINKKSSWDFDWESIDSIEQFGGNWQQHRIFWAMNKVCFSV